MNIDTLPAGRELDALVAERAMGWTKVKVQTESEFGGASTFVLYGTSPINQPWKRVPAYSTDIAAAWEVVEKLVELRAGGWRTGRFFDLRRVEAITDDDTRRLVWQASFCTNWGYEGEPIEPDAVTADTAPLAICRAALKAVGA